MGLSRLGGCGGLARPDGPDGLVGHHHLLGLVLFHRRQSPLKLAPQDLLHGALLPLLQQLSYAEDGGEAVGQGRLHLLGDELVPLAEDVAPLRVAQDHPLHPQLQEHGRGHLAGEGPRIPVIRVLGRHPQPLYAPGHLSHPGEGGEGRGYHHLSPVPAPVPRKELLHEGGGLGHGLVHLPVGGDDGDPHGLPPPHSSRARTPGSSCPSRRARKAPPPVEM